MYHVLCIGVETNGVYETTHYKDALGYAKGWIKEDFARHGRYVRSFVVEQLTQPKNIEVCLWADGLYVARIAKMGDN